METNTLPEGLCVAIIVAAGRGVRAGGEIPKQYQPVAGRPLVRVTMEKLAAHPGIDAICPVIAPQDRDLFHACMEGMTGIEGVTVLPTVFGGAGRQESVLNGMRAIADSRPAHVVIHDAVRPFVPATLVSRVLEGLRDHDGVVPGLPVVDTLKRADDGGRVAATVARDGLWRAQTPQGFRFEPLMRAYNDVGGALDMTDDASVAEAAGLDVVMVDGDERNFKITTADDFIRAEALPCQTETRLGSGFDVHRFCAGNRIRLCGVAIPFERALEGHSDADVGMHALCDALYGAMGAGDIGTHFPPADETWRDTASDVFLRHAAGLIRECGGRIINVDVTLICQRPAISPHREAMRQALADTLDVAVSRVSVKATTTERLGFTGREEGIAAQAVATIAVPVSAPEPACD